MNMTKKFHAMLSLITIGLLVSSGLAVATSDDYAEDFQSYGPGTVITNVSGWTAADDTSVIVATNYTASYQGGDYPLNYDHSVNTRALQIESTVSNTIAAGTSGVTNWVDVVIKPVFSDDPPAVPSGAVAAAYFNTNGNLVVFHAPTWNTLAWLEIPLDNPVAESEWIRLTIAANMADGSDFDDYARFYQIYLNGTVVTNAAAHQTPSSLSGTGGSWFASGASIIRTDPITNVTVQGTGYIDDLVVTNSLQLTSAVPAVPSYIEALPSVSELTEGDTLGDAILTGGSATNALGGAVAGSFAFASPSTVPPVGTNSYAVVFTPSMPASYLSATGMVDVVVVAAPGPEASYIEALPSVSELTEGDTLGAAILTGGSATNALGGAVGGSFAFASPSTVPPVGTNSYDVIFTPSNIVAYTTATGMVEVIVVALPTVTTNGTPYFWYDQFLITPTNGYDNLDGVDSDGDGVLNRDEYVAGTRPDSSNSMFRVIGVVVDGLGNATLKWYGGTNGPTSPYMIESVTNLGSGVVMWMSMTNVQPRLEGTNTWTDGSTNRKFYRVRAKGN